MADEVKEFPVLHKLAAIARGVRGFPCESYGRCDIDAWVESVYIRSVPAGKIQVGQVWKKDDSGESYLITKVYNEAIATFALLRKTGAEAEGTVKVKVDQRGPRKPSQASATPKNPTLSSRV